MLSRFRDGLTYGGFLKNALPSVLSMVFLSFYTTIDGVFVSYTTGSAALASINIVIPISCLIFGIAVMLATGSAAIIGERLGEGRKAEADSTFSLVSCSLLIITMIMTVSGLILLEPISHLLGSTSVLQPYVLPYLATIIAGTIPMAFKLYFEYLVRTDGKPGMALIMSFSGLVLNIVLDFIFVIILDLGTLGAGLGTLFSITASMLIGLVHFLKGRGLRFTKFAFKGNLILKSCTNGSSEMLSEFSTGIVTFLFNLIVLSLYGEDGVAAVTVVMYVYYFFIAFYMGLSVSSAPLVSYSLGAEDYRRIKVVLKYSFFTIMVSSVIITLASFLLSPFISDIFLERGNAWDLTVVGLRFTSFVFVCAGFNVFLSAYFTALGDGLSSAVISTLRSFALVVPLVLILPRLFSTYGIWMTLPLADALTLIVSLSLFFYKGRVNVIRKRREMEKSFSTAQII